MLARVAGPVHPIFEKDESLMYIVAIGWLYVALMMAITETSIVAGVATFLLYGLAPVSIVMYIMGTPGRRRRRKAREAREDREARETQDVRQPRESSEAATAQPARLPDDGGAGA